MRSSIVCVRSSISSSALDHLFGGGEVAVEQRLRAARDRLGGERRETDHVDAQLVERSRGTSCAPRPGPLSGMGVVVTTPPIALRADAERRSARCPSPPILPCDARVRPVCTLGRGQLFIARLLSRHARATGSKRRARTVMVNRERLEDPPSESCSGMWLSSVGSAWPGRARTESAGPGTPPFPAPRSPAGRRRRADAGGRVISGPAAHGCVRRSPRSAPARRW